MIEPPHAYVPGQTPRHPEAFFDHLKAGLEAGMPARALERSTAYQTGLRFIADGYFWEAHEVLEPVWLLLPDGSPERAMVQALIQFANGHLKLLMARPGAALRLADIVIAICEGLAEETVMGQQVSGLRRSATALRDAAKSVI